jgi:hypothetical protein
MLQFRNAVKTDQLKARCAEYYLREVEGVMDVFTEKLLEARDREGEVEDILHQTRQTIHTKKRGGGLLSVWRGGGEGGTSFSWLWRGWSD